jgi:hypothetical protein
MISASQPVARNFTDSLTGCSNSRPIPDINELLSDMLTIATNKRNSEAN